MKCKKEFEYKKAITVDSDMLIQFNEEIGKLCDTITYKAELINGDEIEFDSLDELIDYENSKDNCLKKIRIWATDRANRINDISIYIEKSDYDSPYFYKTVRVVLSTDDIDKSTVFQHRVEHLCNRHSQDKMYQFLSKTGIFKKLYYISFGIIVGFLYAIYKNKNLTNAGTIYICFICIIYALLETPIEKLRKKYYPPIIFYLGDEIKNYDEKKNKRNNFFWTVCIGGGLTIIVGIIGIIFSII